MKLQNRIYVNYGSACLAVGASFLLRLFLTNRVGPALPTYITFYPAVMLVALLIGMWPGIFATIAITLSVDYFLLPPPGIFKYQFASDAVGQVLFTLMGLFMCVVAGQYRRIRSHLEETVDARTTDLRLSNDKLRKSSEDLARSNKDLEQFAYIASHDLQEPLRAIAGFMGLLKRQYSEALNAEALEFVNFAIEGAERMQALIQDLLAFSRVGSRGSAFSDTPLEEAFAEALKNLSTVIGESGAIITNDGLPIVKADLPQMTQLLQNLIQNALKFHGPRRPEVHLSAVQKEQDWVVSVRDNGIGMEQQYFDRIFLIFQRLHTRSQYGGTGIGLAVCKKIVERHGGAIWVESAPGEGSTFYFSIPKTPAFTGKGTGP
jgi:signal transduction histidine kinase